MHVKRDQKVIIIAGKDKGKSGKIVRSFPKLNMVIVEGMNMKKKHMKARKSGQKGEIIEKAMPIHVSNVKLAEPLK